MEFANVDLIGLTAIFIVSIFGVLKYLISSFERESAKDREQDKEQRELDRKAFRERLDFTVKEVVKEIGTISKGVVALKESGDTNTDEIKQDIKTIQDRCDKAFLEIKQLSDKIDKVLSIYKGEKNNGE